VKLFQDQLPKPAPDCALWPCLDAYQPRRSAREDAR
jgi:hypothetical protein